jgi:hypothetical protein
MEIALGKPQIPQINVSCDRGTTDKLSSIIFTHHPVPSTIFELKSLFAMVNYLFEQSEIQLATYQKIAAA